MEHSHTHIVGYPAVHVPPLSSLMAYSSSHANLHDECVTAVVGFASHVLKSATIELNFSNDLLHIRLPTRKLSGLPKNAMSLSTLHPP